MIIVILFLFSNKLQGVAKKSHSKSIKPPSNTSNDSDNEEVDETPQQPSGTIFCFLLISKGSTKNIQSTLL